VLEADLLVDRRRLKRHLNFWRVLTVLAIVLAIGVVAAPRLPLGVGGQHIARINIGGIITEDRKLSDAIVALAKDTSVPAVIVSVDSPGGSVAGGESLHAVLVRLAAAKPVVTVMRGTAASAGYMVSLPAERIFARDSTLTGSIGVILETVQISGLLGKLGVDAEAITSGPLKDQPSYTRPLTEPGRAYLNGLVQDMFDQFVQMVASGRHMDPDAVRKLADGRAYTGRQAKALGLVDEIGGEIEARAWLVDKHGIADTLPVRDLELGSFMQRALGSATTALRTMLFGTQDAGAWAIWTGR
jgi:protease-4